MRILLVGNYVPDEQKSMTAFARMMVRCLSEQGHDVSVISPAIRLLPKNINPAGLWKWVAYVDKYLLFPFTLRRIAKGFDLVHICDHSNALYTLCLQHIPSIVTCHDVLAIEAARDLIPGWRVGYTGKILQWVIFKGLIKASAIVCDSEYTKKHLLNLGWRGQDASVALLTLNGDFPPAGNAAINIAVKQAELQPGAKYFIHVGSDLPRKNRLFVLKVFNEIKQIKPDEDFKLLFVGPELTDSMKSFVLENQLNHSVIAVQDVAHAELSVLYSGAVALIFPSLQEGFGWPIIEAQACGCPVFTSNFPPMSEVGGEGAIYIDPFDEQGAAKIISESLSQLDKIKHKGLVNVSRFSVQNMMSGYSSAYARITGTSRC